MGRYPVTQAQWRAVAMLPVVRQVLPLDPAEFKGADRPVEQVSWEEAQEFCDRLSRYTGRTYRLPTEAEWEYACRAGTTTPFSFGATIGPQVANYNGLYSYGATPSGLDRQKTLPVGQFPPNPFGLCDMHGNVWEWCLDVAHDSYEGAPEQAIAWLSPPDPRTALTEDRPLRIRRGGSWRTASENCRAAARDSSYQDYRFHSYGFRVVCEAINTCSKYGINIANLESQADSEVDLKDEQNEIIKAPDVVRLSSLMQSSVTKGWHSQKSLLSDNTSLFRKVSRDRLLYIFEGDSRDEQEIVETHKYSESREDNVVIRRYKVIHFLEYDQEVLLIIKITKITQESDHDLVVVISLWSTKDGDLHLHYASLPGGLTLSILDSENRVYMQSEATKYTAALKFEFAVDLEEYFNVKIKLLDREWIEYFQA
jgi:hypothetical protein